jgi:hypothetical protein
VAGPRAGRYGDRFATRRLALFRPFAALPAAALIALTLAATAHAAAPVAAVDVVGTATTGVPVSFDGSGSSDPEGGPLDYTWAIDGQDVGVEHDWLSVAFAHPGRHVVTLKVTDTEGLSAIAGEAVSVTGSDRTVSSLKPFGTAFGSSVAKAPELLMRAAPKIPLLGGRLRFVVRCRNATTCRGTVRAVALVGPRGRPVLLASRRFRFTAGAPRILHVRLGAKARRRLVGRTRLRVTAYHGPVRVASTWAVQNYTLRLPARHPGG